MRILGFSGENRHTRVAGIAVEREHIRAFVIFLTVAILVVALGLAACSRGGGSNNLSKRVVEIGEPVPKGGGRYKIGDPYRVGGHTYRPRENAAYNEVGIASWYGELFHGRYTANGEIYDMDALTAAHPTLPLPVYAQVTNLQNGRTIVVRVNDRGPYASNRIIDLSKRSAYALGIYRAGTGKVRVRYIGKAPLDGDDSYERQVLASQPWARMASGYKPSHPAMAFAEATDRNGAGPASAPKSDIVTVASMQKASWPSEAGKGSAALPPPATAAVRDAPAPKPTVQDGRHSLLFVQAGSFREERRANLVRDQLSELGSVHVFPAEVAGAIWYRVRVGPFNGQELADQALEKVVTSGATGARIVRN